jgi:hypothetical protein
MMKSLKQREQMLSYSLDSDETVPFCPECHSYPCACDDNIIEAVEKLKLLDSLDSNSNWPTLRHMEKR